MSGGGPVATRRPTDGVGRSRLVGALVLGLPVVAIADVPAWQFPWWQWIGLLVSLAVVGWAGAPDHRRALAGLTEGRAVPGAVASVASVLAVAWFAYALLTGPAGEIGFTTSAPVRLPRPLRADGWPLGAAVAITIAARWGDELGRRLGHRPPAVARSAPEAALEGTPDWRVTLRRAATAIPPVAIAVAVAAAGFWLGRGAGTPYALAAAVAVLAVAAPRPSGADRELPAAVTVWLLAYSLVTLPVAAAGLVSPWAAALVSVVGRSVAAGLAVAPVGPRTAADQT